MKRWNETRGLALVCAVLLIISAFAMPGWLAAGRNEGKWGTFTAIRKDCHPRAGCAWQGDFTSDDETIHKTDANFDVDNIQQPGDRVRVQAVHGDNSLYGDHENTWLLVAVFDVVSAAYLIWWVKARRWRGPRRDQKNPPQPDPATVRG